MGAAMGRRARSSPVCRLLQVFASTPIARPECHYDAWTVNEILSRSDGHVASDGVAWSMRRAVVRLATPSLGQVARPAWAGTLLLR